MKKIILLTLCLFFLPHFGYAATTLPGSSPWASADEIRVRLLSGVDATGQDATVPLGLEVELKEGWHIYWRSPGAAGLPPAFDWQGSQNLKSATFSWPAPKRMSMQGLESFGYTGHVILPLTATLAAPGQALALQGHLEIMACDSLCVPFSFDLALNIPAGTATRSFFADDLAKARAALPQQRPDFHIASVMQTGGVYTLTAEATPPLTAPELFIEEVQSGKVLPAATFVPPATFTLKPEAPVQGALRFTLTDGARATELEQTFAPALPEAAPEVPFSLTRLLSALGAAFIGGLILNLMPCVLPVLSLKLLALVSHGGAAPRHVRLSFLASAAGIVTSFLALAGITIALKAAGMAIGWGIQFQHPAFLIALVVLLTLFAASLWELISIPLPRFLADAINDRLPLPGEHDRTLVGNFITGAFTTILATPCSAPFVGTALGFALAGSTLDILLVALCMGLGLALPFLLVATFPGLAHRLPRPGRWMSWLRGALGFALMVTALWLANIVHLSSDKPGIKLVGGGVLVALFVLWIARSIKRPVVLLKGTAAIAICLWGLSALNDYQARQMVSARSEVVWQAFAPESIPTLVASGKVVFVDVTADWCLTCLANKKLVIDTPTMQDKLTAQNVVAMRADWTRPDPAIAAYLKTFGRYGIPFNVVYGPGAPQGLPLSEILTKDSVEKALRDAQ